MLTGYWEPTNEMLRPFSKNRHQNRSGWIGRNWEGTGFNVFAFFPEFPEGIGSGKGVGEGDFTVDYQDTLNDFYRIVNQLNPCAIISFSMDSYAERLWTVETAAKVYDYAHWIPEDRIFYDDSRLSSPYRPNYFRWTPSFPDPSYPSAPGSWSPVPIENVVGLGRPNTVFESTLPIDAINSALENSDLFPSKVYPLEQEFDRANNSFLSNFIACLVMKYQNDHPVESDNFVCGAAGHIHVGNGVIPEDGTEATSISLRETIKVLRGRLPFTFITRFRVQFHTAETLVNSDTNATVLIRLKRNGRTFSTKRINSSGLELSEGVTTTKDFSFRRILLDDSNPNELDFSSFGIGGGVEFHNGIFGHFSIELEIEGDDDWLLDEVQLSIKELIRNPTPERFDPLYTVSDWKTAMKWRRLKRLSTRNDLRGIPARSKALFQL